jgi:hypothetical protein
MFQSGFAAAVTETVDLIKAAQGKTAEVEDRLAQELAAIIDPAAVKSRVMLRAAQISKEASLSLDGVNLFAGIDSQLEDLESHNDPDIEGVQDWLRQTNQENIQRFKAIAPTVED